MTRYSANLSTLFQDLPLRERFAAAAQAGFAAVEMWFPYEIPSNEMAAQLQKHALRCVGINSPAGDVSAGDWGLATDPDGVDAFCASVDQAMRYARDIDCPNVHVMAGIVPAHLSRAVAWALYETNIARACDIAQDYGRRVLIEPLNAVDRPTYLLNTQQQALHLVQTLQRDNLSIMLDLFHLQRGEGNLIEGMLRSLAHAAHVQIADVPGRHEPGTGEINFRNVFAAVAQADYKGWVGCEYLPLNSTQEGLSWMRMHDE